MAVAQLAGMCAVGGGLVASELAAPSGYIAHLAAAGIVESARLVDYLPWLAQRVPSPGPVVTGSYYLGLALCLFGPRARFMRVGGTGLAVGAGAAIVLGPIDISAWVQPDGGSHEPMRVLFLDVDQADATLVQLPGGRRCSWTPVAPCEAAFRSVNVSWPRYSGTRAFAGWIISRSHMRIPTTWAGRRQYSKTFGRARSGRGVPVPRSTRLRELRMIARKGRSAWRRLQTGDLIRIGDVQVHVWHPPPPDWERQRVRNDDSLVLELRHGEVSIILTGDIGADVESTLATRIPPAPVPRPQDPTPW